MPLTEEGRKDIQALGGQLYVTNMQGEVWLRPGRLAKLLAVLEASEALDAFIGDDLDRHYFDHIADALSAWRKAIEEAR